jgi:4-hydroxy-4-methyl-2-oxoglutarate aldolase
VSGTPEGMQVSLDVLGVLRQLGSCGVSDVLDRAGLRRLLLEDLGPVTTSGSAVGRALTVQVDPVASGAGRPDRHLGAAAVDAGTDDRVIVIAVSGDARVSGAWGGLLSLAAHTRGICGTVVAGLCRDSDEIRELGYPVYAYGTTPTSARGRLREVAIEVDVTIAGVTVHPYDWIVADGDGVMVVPAVEAADVAVAGTAMLDAEAGLRERIRRGASLGSVLSGEYESLTDPGGARGG